MLQNCPNCSDLAKPVRDKRETKVRAINLATKVSTEVGFDSAQLTNGAKVERR